MFANALNSTRFSLAGIACSIHTPPGLTIHECYHLIILSIDWHVVGTQCHELHTLQQSCLVCKHGQLHAGLVFEGIGFFDVGVAVFLCQYTTLSRHLLSCSSAEPALSDSSIVKMLKERLKPFKPPVNGSSM